MGALSPRLAHRHRPCRVDATYLEHGKIIQLLSRRKYVDASLLLRSPYPAKCAGGMQHHAAPLA